MGRPRKPTKILEINGSARKNPGRMEARGNEPRIKSSIGEAPDYLTSYAADKWNEIVSDPDYGQVLNSSHRETLGHYCLLYGRFVEDAKGVAPMSSSERQTFHSLAMQLGRTPAAQSKVSVPAPAKPESTWDKIAKM